MIDKNPRLFFQTSKKPLLRSLHIDILHKIVILVKVEELALVEKPMEINFQIFDFYMIHLQPVFMIELFPDDGFVSLFQYFCLNVLMIFIDARTAAESFHIFSAEIFG